MGEKQMKRYAMAALIVLLLPVLASASPRVRKIDYSQPAPPLQFERIEDPNVVPDVLAALAKAAAERKKSVDRIAPQAVFLDWALPALLIPAAGSLQGGGGTFFRSDVTLANHGFSPQEVLVIWIPRGVDGRDTTSFRTTIRHDVPPVTTQDFVGHLGLSGLGSLLFVAVEAGTTTPEFALLDGFSRIWTPQPGAQGTVSQPFTAQDPDMLTQEFEAVSLGLRHDANFRTNAGVVNLRLSPRNFIVTVLGERANSTFTMSLPPLSMQQVAIPEVGGGYGALTLLFEPADEDEDAGWAAYGTSVDNITGDGWVSRANLPW
jgi:hypothetical protein